MGKIKIIIVDDSDFIREGMHIILSVDDFNPRAYVRHD